VKFVGVREAQAQLSGLLDRSQKERIVLTRHGQPVAVLSGIEGEDLEAVLLAGNPEFRKLIKERRRYHGEPVTHEALKMQAERELADERKAARPAARTDRGQTTPSRSRPRQLSNLLAIPRPGFPRRGLGNVGRVSGKSQASLICQTSSGKSG
jgi:prevent-host-death family protein